MNLKKCDVCGDRHGIPRRLYHATRVGVWILLGALLMIGVQAVFAKADASSTVVPARAAAVPAPVNYGSGIWPGTTSAVVRSGNPATADVLIVGDSITVRCYPQLRTALAAKGKTLAVVAQSGQRTKGLTDLLMAQLALPPVVVMAAGTNDVFNPFAFGPEIAKAVTWTQDTGAKLYWVDTYVGRTATLAADIRNSGQVNASIYRTAPNIIGWVPALAAAQGRGRPLSYYLADGVHPSVTPGCAFWAGVVAGGIK